MSNYIPPHKRRQMRKQTFLQLPQLEAEASTTKAASDLINTDMTSSAKALHDAPIVMNSHPLEPQGKLAVTDRDALRSHLATADVTPERQRDAGLKKGPQQLKNEEFDDKYVPLALMDGGNSEERENIRLVSNETPS
jgi:hypothetical protein